MSRFRVSETPLVGLKIIERQRLADNRGFLARIFCADKYIALGWHKPVAQINHTSTVYRGTIRGMHFQQPPHSEMKLVSCLQGEVWDVVVDIRSESPTFLHWYCACLSAENNRALLIPEGFAHGFQTLTADVELLYLHSVAYCAESERGLNPHDPALNIDWPLSTTEMSDRDKSHPFIHKDFEGICL